MRAAASSLLVVDDCGRCASGEVVLASLAVNEIGRRGTSGCTRGSSPE
jgi:hypothetical protein